MRWRALIARQSAAPSRARNMTYSHKARLSLPIRQHVSISTCCPVHNFIKFSTSTALINIGAMQATRNRLTNPIDLQSTRLADSQMNCTLLASPAYHSRPVFARRFGYPSGRDRRPVGVGACIPIGSCSIEDT